MDSRATDGGVYLRRCGDEELIAGLMRALEDERRRTATLVSFMGEVDARGLYRKYAYSSMFEYAVRALHMSEGEAYVRIHAARACRIYPVVLEMLARGELHLSGVRLVAPVLTPENHRELLAVMGGKSKREIERLLAGRFPKADVRNEMRRLPGRAVVAPSMPVANLSLEPTGGSADGPAPAERSLETECRSAANPGSLSIGPTPPGSTPGASGPPAAPGFELVQSSTGCESARSSAASPMTAVPGSGAGSRPVAPAMTPLREDRYKVQFTASQRLHDKIRQAQDLLRTQVPDGDLAQICELALDLLIAKRMKERFAVGRKASAPCAPAPAPAPKAAPTPEAARGSREASATSVSQRTNTRHIPNDVRRQVLIRDGGRCTFVSEQGRRCEERGALEFHHKLPYARGGHAAAANICLMCRAHNALHAELDYGRAFMRRRIATAESGFGPRDSTRELLSEARSSVQSPEAMNERARLPDAAGLRASNEWIAAHAAPTTG